MNGRPHARRVFLNCNAPNIRHETVSILRVGYIAIYVHRRCPRLVFSLVFSLRSKRVRFPAVKTVVFFVTLS